MGFGERISKNFPLKHMASMTPQRAQTSPARGPESRVESKWAPEIALAGGPVRHIKRLLRSASRAPSAGGWGGQGATGRVGHARGARVSANEAMQADDLAYCKPVMISLAHGYRLSRAARLQRVRRLLLVHLHEGGASKNAGNSEGKRRTAGTRTPDLKPR